VVDVAGESPLSGFINGACILMWEKGWEGFLWSLLYVCYLLSQGFHAYDIIPSERPSF
jgi:hypothetical protein